jgi:hypothetical protein
MEIVGTELTFRSEFESFEVYWRRMEKLSWTDRVRSENVLGRV